MQIDTSVLIVVITLPGAFVRGINPLTPAAFRQTTTTTTTTTFIYTILAGEKKGGKRANTENKIVEGL